MTFSTTYPIWYQYRVKLSPSHPEHGQWDGGLVTLVIFANSDEDGRAIAGRTLARLGFLIVDLQRAAAITPMQLEAGNEIFRRLYRQAEHDGVAHQFDGWRRNK